jgi:hypothetical protein
MGRLNISAVRSAEPQIPVIPFTPEATPLLTFPSVSHIVVWAMRLISVVPHFKLAFEKRSERYSKAQRCIAAR